MVKQSVKHAMGISIGATIGSCIIPYLFFPERCASTVLPSWSYILLFSLISFSTAFVIFLVIHWIKSIVK